MQRILPAIFLGTGLVFLSTAVIKAAGPGDPDALIPYRGHLDENGQPMAGNVDLRIGLFSSNSSPAADCLDDASLPAVCGVWVDTFANVLLAAGEFSVTLGSGQALPAGLFQTTGGLWLGVAVRRAGTGNYVRLQGLQQLLAAPYAVRADGADDFATQRNASVGGDLDVAGNIRARNGLQVDGAATLNNVTLQGAATIGTATINGDVTLNGRITQGTLGEITGTLISSARKQSDVDNEYTGSYDVSRTRLLVEATFDPTRAAFATASRRVRIHQTRLDQMCSDDDGCTVTIGMKNWSTGVSNTTSFGPFHFYYGPVDGNGDRQWRVSQSAGADDGNTATSATIAGSDGDGNLQIILRDHNCIFTDTSVAPGVPFNSGGDGGHGFYLINYNNDTAYRPICWLIVDD